jgi:serine/threonine protein kinase
LIFIIQSQENDINIKIADFGFAKKAFKPDSFMTQCGTPGYVAPEILKKRKYDVSCDMWSFGVIVYILLGGYPPFMDENKKAMFKNIRLGKFEFHEVFWKHTSKDAQNMISKMLTVDPYKRMTADQALKNKWITLDDSQLTGRSLDGNLDELRKHQTKSSRFRSTAVIANKFNSLGRSMRHMMGKSSGPESNSEPEPASVPEPADPVVSENGAKPESTAETVSTAEGTKEENGVEDPGSAEAAAGANNAEAVGEAVASK